MLTHLFYQSLIRPNLILGCDRELIILSGAFAFILVVISQNWNAAFIGMFLWFTSLAALQRMAKSDPLMRFIYIRHLRYQSYYPHRSTPFRVNTRDYREF